MSARREVYEPQTDAARMARKGGIVTATVGLISVVPEGITLTVNALQEQPYGENAVNIVCGLGVAAVATLFADKAPRHIDAYVDDARRK